MFTMSILASVPKPAVNLRLPEPWLSLVSLGGIARMLTHRSWQTTTIVLLLCLAFGQVGAAERREWVTLTNCQYVAAKYNDGDSFRARCGTKEFIVRLYFVDAPEADLRYPERTREQSEHFGVTLDETMKAGVKAKDSAKAAATART